MSGIGWKPDKMLDIYIHDYMVKNNLHLAAATFRQEAMVPAMPVALDVPGGFLLEWWSVFYDTFAARECKNLEPKEACAEGLVPIADGQEPGIQALPLQDVYHSSLSGLPITMNSQQRIIQLQQDANDSSARGLPLTMNPMVSPGRSAAFRLLVSKICEENSSQTQPRESQSRIQLVGTDRQAVHRSPATKNSLMPSTRTQRQLLKDNKHSINLAISHFAEPMLHGLPRTMLPRSGPSETGSSIGVDQLQLNDWPLNGNDQIYPSLGQQRRQTPKELPHFQFLNPLNEKEVLPLSQASIRGSFISTLSENFPDVDPHATCSIIGSQDAASSFQTASEVVRKLGEIGQRRKQPSPLGKEESLCMSKKTAVSPPNAVPKQTHMRHDEISSPSGVSQSYSLSDKWKRCGTRQDDEHEGALDDNDMSFLSLDDNKRDNTCRELEECSVDQSMNILKGFSFTEVCCLTASKSEVVCCDFSSDGKLLASAGQDKKVTYWNMDNFSCQNTSEEHSLLITDARFKPSSTLLATSSFDKTVQLWNVTEPSSSSCKFVGHSGRVMSIDFHPKVDILCSCDSNGQVRLWDVEKHACMCITKGGNSHIRFQPQIGRFIAAAEENVINIIDITTDQLQQTLKGHIKKVHSISWHPNGEYVASLSEDSVRLWSVGSDWKCIHEMTSKDNKFSSCTFHPQYSLLLVIGCNQSLEFWLPTEGKTMTFPAHHGIISALANSPSTGMIATASYDQCLKVWK